MYYKYKKFDDRLLEMLIVDLLYFADPTSFNDPLDTRPSVDGDLSASDLKEVLRRLVEQRRQAEMTAAAKSIKYRGPKTISHIDEQSRRYAARQILEIEYNSTNPDFEMNDPLGFLLASDISGELLKRYNKGIVSFADKPDCPLMWSHYGHQHHGLCIGYSVPPGRAVEVGAVSYGGSRLVKASDISLMLDGDFDAQRRVDQAVLFTKAKPWKYEHERRLIGARGLQDSPLELEEIIFGLRCPDTVKYTVVKALTGRVRPISFYEMREVSGNFELEKRALDIDDALALWPRRAVSVLEAFETVEVDERGGKPTQNSLV